MTPMQKQALRAPCFHPEETARPEYSARLAFPNEDVSVVLTLNVGMEWAVFFGGAPLWHVSVALWSRLTGRPKAVSSWTQADHARAQRVARDMLAGVGIDDRTRGDTLDIAFHLRKQTRPIEQDSVFKTPRGRAISAAHGKLA